MREPLLLPAIALSCGIVSGRLLEFSASEAGYPALILAGLAAIRASPWLRRLTAFLASTFAGAFLLACHTPDREPWIDAASREVVVLEGCVVEPSIFANDRAQFTLELEAGARARVQVPAFAESAQPPSLRYGQRVAVEARIRTPHGFHNPGAFDYAAYLARRYIFWTALVPSSGTVRVLEGRCGSPLLTWIYGLRSAALEGIDRLYPGDGYASAMMQAVLIGESAGLERIWTEDFRRTGTYHALVISGLHVAVLGGIVLALLRYAPVSRTTALGLATLMAWLYAVVSGFSAPVVRAAGGFTLVFIAKLCFRRPRVLNLLAAISIVYLAIDPEQLFEASFQLSFFAVAAIGALAAPLLDSSTTPLLRATGRVQDSGMDPHIEPRAAQLRVELRLAAETLALWLKIPLWAGCRLLSWSAKGCLKLFEVGAISLAIQIGLALLMAQYFHRVSFTGLTANLAIVPLTNALVPVGFFALFTDSQWAASAAQALLRWSARIASLHSGLEPAWRIPEQPVWIALLCAGSLAMAALSIRRARFRSLAMGAVLAALALLVWSPWSPQVISGQLEVTAIDVGQGDSLLVVFPAGQTMLIDGGGLLSYGRPRRSNLDIGEDVVSTYLWSRGIQRIDILVATHAHQDHAGGLAALITNFHPNELWTGANPPPSLLALAMRHGVRIVQPRQSAPRDLFGAKLQVLAPLPDYSAAEPGNNDSLVLRIEHGSRSVLLTGDLERAIENRLLAAGAVEHADILKVGHHGSRTSTTQPFLDAVSPALAIISAGYENSFGHPHPDVLSRLDERHTTVLRTDLHGLATVRTDGARLWFEIAAWRTRRNRMSLPVHLIN